MNADLADSGRFEQSPPFVPVGVVTDRPSVGLAPDEAAVAPGWPGGHALVKLGGPVCFERHDELGRKRDGAPALIGLEFGEVEPGASSLRARAGVASATGRAVVAVAVLAGVISTSAQAGLSCQPAMQDGGYARGIALLCGHGRVEPYQSCRACLIEFSDAFS
jgi:hypothetical protein